jgi:hypothetical protein
MQTKESTSTYVELGAQAYALVTDAMASANQRALDYMKSVYEITTRPYASNALETAARENFDRANQVMSLTVSELQTSGQKAAEFSEKLVAHGEGPGRLRDRDARRHRYEPFEHEVRQGNRDASDRRDGQAHRRDVVARHGASKRQLVARTTFCNKGESVARRVPSRFPP